VSAGSESEGQRRGGPSGLLLNIVSGGGGLEKDWTDPVGQKLAVQLMPTGVQVLQPWDPL